MTLTTKIETLLSENKLREVIDEFMNFLSDCPASNADAKADANNLKGQIIVLAGRYNSLNEKMNLRTVAEETANTEKSALQYSFFQILSQIPSNYPALDDYMRERDEEMEWKDAKTKNTIDAYNLYFTKYPNGKYKSDTVKLIAELEEVKQRQEAQIKKLAQEEKERRDRDKQEAEEELKRQAQYENENKAANKPTTNAPKQQPTYAGSERVQPSEPDKPSFLKSKKGLLIMGAVVLIVVIGLIISKSGSGSSETEDLQATDTSADAGDAAQGYTANDIINALALHVYEDSNDVQDGNVASHYYLDGDSTLMSAIGEADYQRQDDSFREFQKNTFQTSTDVSHAFDFKTYEPGGPTPNVKVYVKLKDGSVSYEVTKTTIHDPQ